MPFQIIHNDLTKMHTDAIVNAANTQLQMGGGVCGAIFEAAGMRVLQRACDAIGHCPVGQAVITDGYGLPAKYIIHAVGPRWQGGMHDEAKLLTQAYTNALSLAKEKGIQSIAFPLIATGVYGYPKDQAISVARAAIKAFLEKEEMMVYLVVFDRKVVELSESLYSSISHYINHYYVEIPRDLERMRIVEQEILLEECMPQVPSDAVHKPFVIKRCYNRTLESLLDQMEETFTEMLLRLIDERDLTDVEVYKKANMDRKLFSKIRSKKDYTPKKATVLALAIALELSLDETKDLLMRAGYALTMSHKADVIISYFIEHQEYNLFIINETLFYFEQPLLGSA